MWLESKDEFLTRQHRFTSFEGASKPCVRERERRETKLVTFKMFWARWGSQVNEPPLPAQILCSIRGGILGCRPGCVSSFSFRTRYILKCWNCLFYHSRLIETLEQMKPNLAPVCTRLVCTYHHISDIYQLSNFVAKHAQIMALFILPF